MVTVSDVLIEAAKLLKDTGSSSVRLDSEVILAYVLGCSRLKVMTSYDMPLSQCEADEFMEYINLRAQGKPVAYIIGQKEFMALKFYLNDRVLIPRGDTEIAAETVINECQRHKSLVRVLDLGCGSGAIGISTAHYCANAVVTMADISDAAVEIAAFNAVSNKVSDRTRIIKSDLFEKLSNDQFEIIVSNPPYIKSAQIPYLQRDVREYEPVIALDGGEDGLDFYRKITHQSKEHIDDCGMLVYEIGYDQADAVKKIMTLEGFKDLSVLKDLAGLDRCIYGRKL